MYHASSSRCSIYFQPSSLNSISAPPSTSTSRDWVFFWQGKQHNNTTNPFPVHLSQPDSTSIGLQAHVLISAIIFPSPRLTELQENCWRHPDNEINGTVMSLHRVTCAEMNKSVWGLRQGGREQRELLFGCFVLFGYIFPEDLSLAGRTSVHGWWAKNKESNHK